VELRQLAQTTEPVARVFRPSRGRRHRGQTYDAVAEVVGDLRGSDPAFRVFACEIDLYERGHVEPCRRRVRVEGVDELADPVHDLHLVRLEPADEVPAERVAVLGVLGFEILDAVLTDDLDPCLGEDRHLRERGVLRRRDDGHCGPDFGLHARVVRGDLRR